MEGELVGVGTGEPGVDVAGDKGVGVATSVGEDVLNVAVGVVVSVYGSGVGVEEITVWFGVITGLGVFSSLAPQAKPLKINDNSAKKNIALIIICFNTALSSAHY